MTHRTDLEFIQWMEQLFFQAEAAGEETLHLSATQGERLYQLAHYGNSPMFPGGHYNVESILHCARWFDHAREWIVDRVTNTLVS